MVRIFELLTGKSASRILRYFLEHPTREIHAGLLIKEVKMSRKAMFDGLSCLLSAGLLGMKEIGRTKQYHLARDHPLVKQLKTLLSLDAILPLLKGLEGCGVEVYLYGSAARGEDTEKSDIDLLLIGDMPREVALGKIRGGQRVKPVYLTFLEYSTLARKDRAFYERLEKDRKRLI